MTEINDLRQRVEAAEERFGLMDEQQRHYSARLIGLIETIEAQLAAARSEVERQIAENQRLSQENEELRGMLHSVLRSIEQKTFTETLQNLESRVSALVGQGDVPAAPTAADAAEEDVPAMDTMMEPEEAAGDDTAALIIEPAAQEETPEEESSAEMTAGDGPAEAEAVADAPAMDEMPAEDMPMQDMAADDMAAPETPEEAASDAEAAGDMNAETTPEAAMEDVAFEDDPLAMAEDTGVEDAGAEATVPEAAEPEMFEAEMAGAAAAEAADEDAPSVKEIIRRVGDLARELEKAEATRKASMAEEAENEAAESPAEGEASDDAPPDDAWGQAANG